MSALVEKLRQFNFPKIDGAWLAVLLLLAGLAAFDQAQLPASLAFMAKALTNTAPYILFAVLAVAGRAPASQSVAACWLAGPLVWTGRSKRRSSRQSSWWR